MWILNLFLLSFKQLRRHWMRTLLTVSGTAAGMFLFLSIEALQNGLRDATETQAGDDTLVVYRDKRFCPFTSRLPIDYQRKIATITGVSSVTPVKVVVNNCGTSLDTVCFRGIPKNSIEQFLGETRLLSGSFTQWNSRSDNAFLGKALAERRGLKVGDRFDAAGVTVTVCGVLDSDSPQDLNAAYVHLGFLQQASGHGLGIVTQFNVKVKSSSQLKEVSQEIDALFRHDREPTSTRSEKAFVAQTAKDMIDLIRFTRWLGLAAVFAVLALVSNTVILAVRGRARENAVLQALGYGGKHLVFMTICEGLVFGLCGGLVGSAMATAVINYGSFSLSGEGVSLVFGVSPLLYAKASIVALIIGLLAGVYPALSINNGALSDKLRKV